MRREHIRGNSFTPDDPAFLPAPFQPPAHAAYQNHDQNQPDPVLQMLVEIVQPRRNHLPTSVTDSGKNQRRANAPRIFSGRKIFGGSWLAPISVGPMTRKPYKTRTNDKQIRMALDKFLRPLNFILMFRNGVTACRQTAARTDKSTGRQSCRQAPQKVPPAGTLIA